VVAPIGTQREPVPPVLLPGSFHDCDLASLFRVQYILRSIPAVLRPGSLRSRNRSRVRRKESQTRLRQFRRKNMQADWRARQRARDLSLRRTIA